MALEPKSVSYKGVAYSYRKQLGKGGTGSVTLYGDEQVGYLVLKISYCNNPQGKDGFFRELRAIQAVEEAPICSTESLHWRRDTERARPSDFVRKPLSWKSENGCFYTLLEYYPSNLSEWLRGITRYTTMT